MNNKISNLFIRLNRLSPWSRGAITAFLAIVSFTIGALLEERVQKFSSDQPGEQLIGIKWILVLLLIALLWGLLRYWYLRVLEAQLNNREEKQRAITNARERLTKLSVQHLARCDAIVSEDSLSFDEIRSVLICEIDRIKALVDTAWEVVNSHHNVSVDAIERINFEMTLITSSIRDSELTIAAWCNRDNLRPKSLLIREREDTRIYQLTEAAKMISKRITDTIIIEDTSEPAKNYQHLYEGQKERIRSSVLHPILSSKNEHLGVLVLHCERAGFFRDKDRWYWRELLSVFSAPIALEIERIKAFNKIVSAWPSRPSSKYEPY